MTPEQISVFAKEAGLHEIPVQALLAHARCLLKFAAAIEANTREECAKVIEQDLYPDDAGKPYTQQYNDSIKRLADKIRGLK